MTSFWLNVAGWMKKIYPGCVCLPGGPVGINEGREEALKKELLEKLDIKVK